MNATDEMAAQPETTEHRSASVAPGSGDKFDEQLRATVKDFQRTSDQWTPVEELQNQLSRIDHHLEYETSERRAIYYRLVAMERATKRRGSREFAGYLVAICIGIVAGALAWHSYGESSKQIIATAVTPTAAVGQTVEQHLAAMRETVEQLAARQEQMEREITKLQAAVMEILAQSPLPPARPSANPAYKPMHMAPPSSRQP